MRSARRNLPRLSVALCATVAAAILSAGAAQAATYPAGGGAFNGGLEGWTTPTKAACNIPLGGLCTATAGYDGENGNPPGSLAANTTILVNLGGVFKSTATFQSPNFTASEGGAATLHVDRELSSGNLLDLAPKADYVVRLIDRTGGVSSEALVDSVTAAAGFTGKDGAATLTAGHTYAISIDAETSSSVANVGLLGSTALRFDNVALTVGSSGGGNNGKGNGGSGGKGGAGGAGDGGLSDSRLLSLLRADVGGTAVLKGTRLFVKRSCPAKVGRACRVSLQGLLKKSKPATARRTGKVAKGKTKTLVLKVKPRAVAALAQRNRLLFKQTVKAGKAQATVYKRLKLVRR
ncbi:MAG TPA: hypothetical protein VEW07_10540 [Solirubrobacterales bacterium]|nr:hypothetical protein [Solirubrobacterales bacterium]